MCRRRVIYSGTMRGPEATKTRPDASWATTIHEFVNRIFPPPVPPRTRSRHGHVSRVTREPTASPLLLLLLLLARTAPHNRPIDEKRLHGWNKLTRAEMTEYPTAITKYTVLRERAKTERGGRGRIGRKIIAVSKRVRLRIGLAGLFTILLSEYLLGMLSTAGLGKGEKLE